MPNITEWNIEDERFWDTTGKRVANRNLWISIPSLLCGFAVWLYWGIITVQMLNLGFPFAKSELFTLTAIAGLTGAIAMILSATIVNVAVPSIMGAFGVGQDVAQWAATAFLATMVASQLLNAWMVQALGQRIAYGLTLGIFVIGSFVCALSTSIDVLIAGRIMQGFSAGVIQPLVLATMVAVFPYNRRGFAVGMYGLGVTLAPSFGPWSAASPSTF